MIIRIHRQLFFRALHTLWEEIAPDDVAEEGGFDNKGKCLQCGSRISFADVTDTLVFVGDEIVKPKSKFGEI
jgi:hypothetical protein